MTTPRGFRDRADDSLLTLLGEVPELIRNLVIAEIDAAKAWLARTAPNRRTVPPASRAEKAAARNMKPTW